MLTIGLTGGIGSGKSTVANYFAELGITIIDADLIAREVVVPDSPALQNISQHFGKEILNPNGELDRKKLRDIIFADTQQRDWLENLLHPLIRQVIKQRLLTATSPYCVVVIPLLLEKNMQDWVDRILVVDATEQLQKTRLQQRDQLTAQQIDTMLATQLTRQQRLTAAHDTINNDGDRDALHAQVTALHKKYLALNTSSS